MNTTVRHTAMDARLFSVIVVEDGDLIEFDGGITEQLGVVDVGRDRDSGKVRTVMILPRSGPAIEAVLLFSAAPSDSGLPLADMPAPVVEVISSALGLTVAEITGVPVQ